MGLISVVVQPSKNRVVVTGRGDLVASDIMDAATQVYEDPEFRQGMNSLLDVRGALPAVSADNVRAIVSFVARNLVRRGRGRCAVVINREVDYGMARMAQVYMDEVGLDLEVFRDLESAERWLDRDGGPKDDDASDESSGPEEGRDESARHPAD